MARQTSLGQDLHIITKWRLLLWKSRLEQLKGRERLIEIMTRGPPAHAAIVAAFARLTRAQVRELALFARLQLGPDVGGAPRGPRNRALAMQLVEEVGRLQLERHLTVAAACAELFKSPSSRLRYANISKKPLSAKILRDTFDRTTAFLAKT